MAVLRMKPLTPCGHAVLLAFDPPRRLEERHLLGALDELGVSVSNNEAFAPADGAFPYAWFFCATAADCDYARALILEAAARHASFFSGVQVSVLERAPPQPEFDYDGMEARFAVSAAAATTLQRAPSGAVAPPPPPLPPPPQYPPPPPPAWSLAGEAAQAPQQAPYSLPVGAAHGGAWSPTRPPSGPGAVPQRYPPPPLRAAVLSDADAFLSELATTSRGGGGFAQAAPMPVPAASAGADGWFVMPPAPSVPPALHLVHNGAGFAPLPPPPPFYPAVSAGLPLPPPPHMVLDELETPAGLLGLLGSAPSAGVAVASLTGGGPLPPPPGFGAIVPGARPAPPGAPAAWRGALHRTSRHVCNVALQPLREAEHAPLSDAPWPSGGVLRDEQRASLGPLLGGEYGPIAAALTSLAWVRPAAAEDAAAVAAVAELLERDAKAVAIPLPGGRYELLLLPSTRQVVDAFALPRSAAMPPPQLLAAVVPARWSGRLEAVTRDGEVVGAPVAVVARPCDSRGAALALPEAVRLTARAPLERAVRSDGFAAGAFAFAPKGAGEAPGMAKLVARYADKRRAACAPLPQTHDKLWLFPSPDGQRFNCLAQSDAVPRGLLHLT